MGYAYLNYLNNNTAPIGHIVHDIVGIVTGTYTNVNQLSSSVTPGLSQIINSAGRGNWEFVFPSTHGTRATNTNNYVLRAPCISSGSKFKFARIWGVSASDYNLSTGNLNLGTSTSSSAITMTSATAAASATSLSNQTPYNTWSSSANDYRWTSKNLFFGPNFYISWSSRHLLIAANGVNWTATNPDMCFIGVFEHTETSISTYRATAPFCNLTLFDTVNAYGTSTAPGNIDSSARFSYFTIYNHYNPASGIASGIINLANDFNSQWEDFTVGAQGTATYPTVYTKNSSGSNAMFMQPLFWHQHWRGIPHQYITSLCDVYRVPAGLGNNGDLLTVGADTYVYFTGASGNYGLAARRA